MGAHCLQRKVVKKRSASFWAPLTSGGNNATQKYYWIFKNESWYLGRFGCTPSFRRRLLPQFFPPQMYKLGQALNSLSLVASSLWAEVMLILFLMLHFQYTFRIECGWSIQKKHWLSIASRMKAQGWAQPFSTFGWEWYNKTDLLNGRPPQAYSTICHNDSP